jgi:hypothetical protein
VNEISLRETDSWAAVIPAVADLATRVSNTSFVPESFRGKQAEIAACILTGREVGIGPMEALQKIYSIKGKPTMSAELMRSLALRAGHEITFPVLTDDKVTAKGRRAGSQQWTEVTWTMKDAQRIGVTGKDTWKKHPRQMLEARATSELCRLLFPDALGAVSYTQDELEEEQGEQPRTAVRRSKGRASEVAQDIPEPELGPQEPPQAVLNGADGADGAAVTVEATADPEIVDAEIIDDEPVMVTAVMDGNAITGPQTKMMGAAMRTLGMDRDQALDFCREHTGRDIQSRNDLTKTEATAIIEALHALRDLTGASDA